MNPTDLHQINTQATDAATADWCLPGILLAADGVSPGNMTQLTTGDLNGDGYPDIAAAHGFRSVGLFLHQDARSFTAEHVLTEPLWNVNSNIGATSIAVGDLDLDGNLDLVIPIYGPHFRGHMVQIYKGLGDGSFDYWPVDGYDARSGSESAGQDGVVDGIVLASGAANPMFPVIADFNSDGRPDIAVSGNNGSWSVDVLLQSPGMGFAVSDSDPAGQNPQFMAQGDFNGDGHTDLAVGALYTGVSVFLNDGDGNGTLNQNGGTYLSRQQHYVVVADFNGDGLDDIVARGNADSQVSILFGNGSGGFPTTRIVPVSGVDGYLAPVDFDLDGDTDLVVASRSTRSVDLLLNEGDGVFGAPESVRLSAAPWGIAVDDFDQDGLMDVAVARDDNTVQVLWNLGRDTVRVVPAAFTVAENSDRGSILGNVTARGLAPFTFAISAGNTDADGDTRLAFAIDAASGVLTVNDPGDLDFETNPKYALAVTATNRAGLSATTAVSVDLDNVDEPGNEVPQVLPSTFELAENSAVGVVVGTMSANDIDAGDTLNYAIRAGNLDPDGNGQSAFSIDAATGAISVNDASDLDFEITPLYTLTVRVSDVLGLSASATATVKLSDIFERIGTASPDFLTGTAGGDLLDGRAGNDTLTGGPGDDTLIGGLGSDLLYESGNLNFTLSDGLLTGAGTDSLSGIERARLTGGTGDNRLDASAFNRGSVVLTGGAGNDTLVGPSLTRTSDDRDDSHNVFVGGDGDDSIIGGAGLDRVHARGDYDFTLKDHQLTGMGTDSLVSIEQAVLIGGAGANRLDASTFGDSLVILEGRGGNDTLIGRAGGIDIIRARGDVDFILTDTQLTGLGTDSFLNIDKAQLTGYSGGNHFDASAFTRGPVKISAGAGDDTLIGGLYKDTLTGGAGADVFRFTSADGSGVAAGLRDLIRDFDSTQGDLLDLLAIDGDTMLAGHQSFSELAEGPAFTGEFTSAGALYFDTTAHTLFGNLDADPAADFAIQLPGVVRLLDALLV